MGIRTERSGATRLSILTATRVIGAALVAALAWSASCAESAPHGVSGGPARDDASASATMPGGEGAVDLEARATVEAAVGAPTIVFTSAVPSAPYMMGGVTVVDVNATVTVTGFQPGTEGLIVWYLDASPVATSAVPSNLYVAVPQGVHKLGVMLVGMGDGPVGGPGGSSAVPVLVSNPCATTADCDSGTPCYVAQCLNSAGGTVCKYGPSGAKACCQSDFDCSYPNTCATVGPNANMCVQCTSDADCDDVSDCTVDTCNPDGTCSNVKPDPTCCSSDEECDDGSPCTIDTCNQITKTCTPTKIPGACCVLSDCPDSPCKAKACKAGVCLYGPVGTCCTTDAECDDKNPCTVNACSAATKQCDFSVKVSESCCTSAASCDDGSPCTVDACQENACVHTATPTAPGCCSVDGDCDDGSICTVDTCSDWQCQHTPQCDLLAEYKEPFTVQPGQDLGSLGFMIVELGQQPQIGHWSLAKVLGDGFGSGHVLRFDGGNGLVDLDLESCAMSPVFNTGPGSTWQVGWKARLQHESSAAPMELRVQLAKDGDWAAPQTLWSTTTSSSIAGASHQVEIGPPSPFLGGKKVQLRFCVKTANTYGAWSWAIDDVFIVGGKPPVFVGGVYTQAVTVGQTKIVSFKAKDGDKDPLSFEAAGPKWATLAPPTYSQGDGTWSAALTLAPPDDPSLAGVWPVSVRVSDGGLSADLRFDVVLRHEGGVLVWSPPGVTGGAADAIRASLVKLGRQAQIQHAHVTYPDLSTFEAVFVTLGAWPNTHTLTASDADKLAAYLNGGGRLYLEGGDAFTGPQTALTAMLHATGTADGAAVEGLQGSTLLEGESWACSTSPILNASVDHLDAQAAPGTVIVLRNLGAEPYVTVVAHDEPGGYRTLASSVLFAGVEDGTATSLDLMAAWLDFLEGGL